MRIIWIQRHPVRQWQNSRADNAFCKVENCRRKLGFSGWRIPSKALVTFRWLSNGLDHQNWLLLVGLVGPADEIQELAHTSAECGEEISPSARFPSAATVLKAGKGETVQNPCTWSIALSHSTHFSWRILQSVSLCDCGYNIRFTFRGLPSLPPLKTSVWHRATQTVILILAGLLSEHRFSFSELCVDIVVLFLIVSFPM